MKKTNTLKNIINKRNISKFSWAEMSSNETGKTSASGTIGIIVSLVGSFGFLVGILDKIFFSSTVDILDQSIIVIGIGAGLLGFRKGRDGRFQGPEEEYPQEETNDADVSNQEGCKD